MIFDYICSKWYDLRVVPFLFGVSMSKNPVCQYCGNVSSLVKGDKIYPHLPKLHHKNFYQCSPCDAYVGCHPDTDVPLGRLANAELRKYKLWTHGAFDKLWKSGTMSRSEAYKMLAKKMGIDAKDCHIGMFTVEQCKQALAITIPMTKEL